MRNPEVYDPVKTVIETEELTPEQLYRMLADSFAEIAVPSFPSSCH